MTDVTEEGLAVSHRRRTGVIRISDSSCWRAAGSAFGSACSSWPATLFAKSAAAFDLCAVACSSKSKLSGTAFTFIERPSFAPRPNCCMALFSAPEANSL